MDKYDDGKGSTLLVTKDKVVLILNPYQFQALRRAYLKQNQSKEPERFGSYNDLSNEMMRFGAVTQDLMKRYNGTLLTLFDLIKDKKHEDHTG